MIVNTSELPTVQLRGVDMTKHVESLETEVIAALRGIVKQNIRYIEKKTFKSVEDVFVLKQQRALLRIIKRVQSERIKQLPLF